MLRATGRSPRRCSLPIIRTWSSNGSSQNERSRRDDRSVLDPIARILLEKRQRLERVHPIEKEDPVEVIVLVLQHARGEILRAQLDAAAGPIERADLDL